MIFAQAAPPAEIAAWLACAGFVLFFANQGFKLKSNLGGESQKREIAPQPFVVEMAKQFTNREEFEKLMEENAATHRELFSKMGGVERGQRAALDEQVKSIRAELREDVQGIHIRINSIDKSMGAVEATVQLTNQNFASLAASIRDLAKQRNS